MQPRRSTRRYHLTPSSTEPPPSRRGGEAPACNRADYGRYPPPPRLHLATRRRSASAHALLGRRRAGEGLHPGRRRAHCLARGSEAQRSAPEGLRRRRAAAAWTHSRSPPLTCTAFSKCFSAAPPALSPGRARRCSAGRGQPSISPGCRADRVLVLPLPCRVSGAGWRNACLEVLQGSGSLRQPGPGVVPVPAARGAVPGVWGVLPSLAGWCRCRQYSCAGCLVGLTPHV